MMRLFLSNDRTEVDMDRLARAFSISNDELETRIGLGTITYWFEQGDSDTDTPRMIFRASDTGQHVTLDRVGRIISPADILPADQPVPCNETCRPVEPNYASRQSPKHVDARCLDVLLDDALRGTFPASDPVAICFDAPRPGGVTLPEAS